MFMAEGLMNRSILYFSIVVSASLLGVLHYKIKPQIDEAKLKQYSEIYSGGSWHGRIAPDFTLKTLDGKQFDLAENVGKKMIVLNFFATWCGPCRGEMPELNRYYNEHKTDPFLMIAIDAGEGQERVDEFMEKVHVDFPVAIDDGDVRKKYRVSSLPTTVVIGVDGRVQVYEVGALSNTDVAFANFLESNRKLLISGNVISAAEYRATLQKAPQVPEPKDADAGEKEVALDERGTRIASSMVCPCGCDDTVKVCKCQNAKKIRKALATEDFKKQSDNEIIRALNKRFCSGAM
jgi:thiol-disulfide isomerase/thioredoxin